jgi:hypothetical protein
MLALAACKKKDAPEPEPPKPVKTVTDAPPPPEEPQPGLFITYEGEPFVADQTGPVVVFVDVNGVRHFIRRPDEDYQDRPDCETCQPRTGLEDPVYEKDYNPGVVLQIGPGRVDETVTRNCTENQATACLATQNLAAGVYQVEVTGVLICSGQVRVPIQDEVVLRCRRGL